MRIELKNATSDDVPWLLEQMRAFSKFYGTKVTLFPDDEVFAHSFASKLIEHFCVVAWRGNDRMGFISGFLTVHPYNPSIKVFAETFWWVTPEFRKSGAGLLLLDRFTEYGKENADWITFVLEHHSPVNDDCLIGRGFKLNEKSYLLEV